MDLKLILFEFTPEFFLVFGVHFPDFYYFVLLFVLPLLHDDVLEHQGLIFFFQQLDFHFQLLLLLPYLFKQQITAFMGLLQSLPVLSAVELELLHFQLPLEKLGYFSVHVFLGFSQQLIKGLGFP